MSAPCVESIKKIVRRAVNESVFDNPFTFYRLSWFGDFEVSYSSNYDTLELKKRVWWFFYRRVFKVKLKLFPDDLYMWVWKQYDNAKRDNSNASDKRELKKQVAEMKRGGFC